jgi:hypothetical protein
MMAGLMAAWLKCSAILVQRRIKKGERPERMEGLVRGVNFQ